MEQRKLRVALVGCGRMGAFTTDRTRNLIPDIYFPLSHTEAIEAHPGLELVAACDTDMSKAREAVARFGSYGATAWIDASEMLASVETDILSVATRTSERPHLVAEGVRRGVRGIHSEKPFSTILRETEDVVSLIKERRAHLTYGTLRRFMAPYRTAKKLLLDGEIGDLKEISVAHGYKELLLWSHPHSVDLLLYYADAEPVAVNAICDFGDSHVSDGLVDCDPKVDFARVTFSNGVHGIITSGTGACVTLSGSEGVIRIHSNGEKVELSKRSTTGKPSFKQGVEVDVAPANSGTLQALSELHDSILGIGQASMRPDDVLLNQRVLWSIVGSARNDGRTFQVANANRDTQITGRVGEMLA